MTTPGTPRSGTTASATTPALYPTFGGGASTTTTATMNGNGVAPPPARSDFWKDDFVALQSAGKSILNVLRQDESSAHGDLYRRILSTTSTTATTTSSADLPNHHYFSNGAWNHLQSIPLPAFLQQELSKAKLSTMMGLFPEAEMAWMTIDDSIYLWTYASGDNSNVNTNTSNEFLHFQVPSHQPIVSVGLAPPKKGKKRTANGDCAKVRGAGDKRVVSYCLLFLRFCNTM